MEKRPLANNCVYVYLHFLLSKFHFPGALSFFLFFFFCNDSHYQTKMFDKTHHKGLLLFHSQDTHLVELMTRKPSEKTFLKARIIYSCQRQQDAVINTNIINVSKNATNITI